MKKYLSLITAGTICATLIPLASAANNARFGAPRPGYNKPAVGERVSRRVLESGAWAYRARVRHGYTRPKSFATDKKMSSSSSSSSSSSVSSSASTSSSMSSSASSN